MNHLLLRVRVVVRFSNMKISRRRLAEYAKKLRQKAIIFSHSTNYLHYLALGKVPFWLVAVFAYVVSYTTSLFRNIFTRSPPHFAREKDRHNTGNFTFYSFYVLLWNFNMEGTVRRDLGFIAHIPRRLVNLTICWCSTFSSVILRPWVLVRPESNFRPPAWQPDAQPTEPPR